MIQMLKDTSSSDNENLGKALVEIVLAFFMHATRPGLS